MFFKQFRARSIRSLLLLKLLIFNSLPIMANNSKLSNGLPLTKIHFSKFSYASLICGFIAGIVFTMLFLSTNPLSNRASHEFTFNDYFNTARSIDQPDEKLIERNVEGFNQSSYECRCGKLISSSFERNALGEIDQENSFDSYRTSRDSIIKRHPNIGRSSLANESRCDLIPFVTGLNWDGVWQVLEGSVRFQLYSVNCVRNDNGECKLARIMSMASTFHFEPLYCYFWETMSSDPIVVRAHEPQLVHYRANSSRLYPFLINCEPPSPLAQITGVSLSELPCSKATNFLEIGYTEQELYSNVLAETTTKSPYEVAICGPALYYYHNDASFQLIEWLEIVKKLKFTQVFFYLTNVHPNIDKVLKHYENEGFVKITSFSYPYPYINEPRLQRAWTGVHRTDMFALENVYFTHCLLSNRHHYRHLMHIDPDEIPMLGEFESISDLVESEVRNNRRRFGDKPMNIAMWWKTFHVNMPPSEIYENVPKEFFFLRHSWYETECGNPWCKNFKTIYDTDHTIACYSHRALICEQPCHFEEVDLDIAYVGHFRNLCLGHWCDTQWYTEETFLVKYRDEIVQETIAIKNLLGT